MTGAFNVSDVIGSPVFGTVVSDFWVALRGNGSLAWGSSSGTISGVTGVAKTGTISASFLCSDFSAGSTVNYTVFLNNIAEGGGSFIWSDTDANYIGLDARDAVDVGLDNFSVATVPEPSTLAVALLGAASWFIRRRKV